MVQIAMNNKSELKLGSDFVCAFSGYWFLKYQNKNFFSIKYF
jgi:hypothetical protein